MTTARIALRHSRKFEPPRSWALAADGSGLVLRFREASEPESVLALPFVELELRPTMSGWVSKPQRVANRDGLFEFSFEDAPEEVDEAIRKRKLSPPRRRA